VKYPKSINDLPVIELRALAVRLGIPIHDSNNRAINKPELLSTVRRWKELNGISLDSHTCNDQLNIVNAREEAIDINLNVRFGEEWQHTDEWQQLQTELSVSSTPVEVKRKALKVCLLLEEHLSYTEQLDGKNGIDDVRAIIMDILHCKVRVKNKLLALLVQSVYNRIDLSSTEKDKRLKAVNFVIGRIYASKIGTESNIKVNVDKGKVVVTTINGDKLDKLNEQAIDDILDVIYVTEEEKDMNVWICDGQESKVTYHNWKVLFKLFEELMEILRTPGRIDPSSDFLRLSDKIDQFGDLFIDMYAYEHIGNYFHYLISGHVINQLRSCDYNLSYYQQQGTEAMNKHLKAQYLHRSNRGGGKNPVHPAVDILRSFGRKWLRMIEKYFPGWVANERENITSIDLQNWRYNDNDTES
jgi:hypothetical protein